MKTDLLAVGLPQIAHGESSPRPRAEMRRDYYGERSLNGLRAVAEGKLHRAMMRSMPPPWSRRRAMSRSSWPIRMTQGPAKSFPPAKPARLVRCAVDIRNIDVEAASAAGVLVRGEPGFVHRCRTRARFLWSSVVGVARQPHNRRAPADVGGNMNAGIADRTKVGDANLHPSPCDTAR